MVNFYVSEDALKSTIRYFSSMNYNSPEQIGVFLFFKSIGLNEKEYIPFKKTSQMEPSEKIFYNNLIHHLCALFSFNETGKKRTCLFPTSIKDPVPKNAFFNGGSEYKNILSRLTDTVDNSLVDKFLDKNDDNEIKFKRGYIQYIKDTFLDGNKISLSFLACWVCRFVEFSLASLNGLDNEGFTRVCVKYTKELLNLNELELQNLFEEDATSVLLSYSQNQLTGNQLRSLLRFEEAPEVIETPQVNLNLAKIILSQKEVLKYMELNDKNPSSTEIKEVLRLKKQVILYGVPGVGKSKFVSDIEGNYSPDNVKKIQFHPSTSYEDFIGGTTIKDGDIVTQAGIFLETCLKAAEKDQELFLFVIDEINRGNISKIFGETILALDREYAVDLIKPIKVGDKIIDKLIIPDNLDIVATMNSTDRSIAILDFAIRRRFGFIKLNPNYEVVGNLSELTNLNINVEKLFRGLNDSIIKTLNDENLILGQSYFLPKFVEKSQEGKILWKKSDLRYVFNYFIIPTLEEYTYGNRKDLIAIIGDKIAGRIDDDNEFIEAIEENFPQCKL